MIILNTEKSKLFLFINDLENERWNDDGKV